MVLWSFCASLVVSRGAAEAAVSCWSSAVDFVLHLGSLRHHSLPMVATLLAAISKDELCKILFLPPF